jgi:hypothetical protein
MELLGQDNLLHYPDALKVRATAKVKNTQLLFLRFGHSIMIPRKLTDIIKCQARFCNLGTKPRSRP